MQATQNATEPEFATTTGTIDHVLIVRFRNSAGGEAQKKHLKDLKDLCAKYPSDGKTTFKGIRRVFTAALQGYTGEFHPTVEQWIRAQNEVEKVNVDMTMRMAEYVSTSTSNWGLTAISDGLPATWKYRHSKLEGRNVIVHILDDGYDPINAPYKYERPPTKEIEDARVIYASADQGERNTEKLHGFMAANFAAGKTLGAAPQAKISVHKVTERISDPKTNTKVIVRPSMALATIALDQIVESINNEPGNKSPRVINCSWGIPASKEQAEIFLGSLYKLMNELRCTVIVAAGNDGAELVSGKLLPTGELNVITVGALDKGDKLGQKTNFGSCVDLYAPGVDLPTSGVLQNTQRGGANAPDQNPFKTLWSGTSFAAPIVSGIVACVLAEHRAAHMAIPTSAQVKDLFQHHWTKITTQQKNQTNVYVNSIRNRTVTARENCAQGATGLCKYCQAFPTPVSFIDGQQ